MPRRSSRALALASLCGALACATLSVDEERDLGREINREIRTEYRFVTDHVVVDYVDAIGRDILRAAGPQPFEYEFYVVDDPEINAFAAPAGHVYMHTGTILKARDVSELAGVMAHEVGHVVHRHIAENYNKQVAAGLGHQALVVGAGILGGGAAANAANLLGGLGLTAVLNTFGREAERESDDFAVTILPQAGYDPRGMPSFFETLAHEGGGNAPAFLSSHPAPEERLETTRAKIASLDLPPGLKVHDNGRLEIIQRRIRLLTGEVRPGRD